MESDTLFKTQHKFKKIKVDKKGKILDKGGTPIEGDDTIEPLGPVMIQPDEVPTLVCIRYSETEYRRIEILPIHLGPKGTKFDYRIVYDPDDQSAQALIARGRSPFEGLTCEEVWAVKSEDFDGYEFGENTPTGGGEGGGTVGGGS